MSRNAFNTSLHKAAAASTNRVHLNRRTVDATFHQRNAADHRCQTFPLGEYDLLGAFVTSSIPSASLSASGGFNTFSIFDCHHVHRRLLQHLPGRLGPFICVKSTERGHGNVEISLKLQLAAIINMPKTLPHEPQTCDYENDELSIRYPKRPSDRTPLE